MYGSGIVYLSVRIFRQKESNTAHEFCFRCVSGITLSIGVGVEISRLKHIKQLNLNKSQSTDKFGKVHFFPNCFSDIIKIRFDAHSRLVSSRISSAFQELLLDLISLHRPFLYDPLLLISHWFSMLFSAFFHFIF